VERRLPGVAVNPADVRSEVDDVLDQVLTAAALKTPAVEPMSLVGGRAGRDGVHTEAMGYLLAEMQHLARSLPGAKW
jgi:ring-1,2-phenylacetyl-CoA epoxidase subunit PaaC